MACFAVCGVLTAMIRRGRTKQYIKQLYDDMCVGIQYAGLFRQADYDGYHAHA